MSILLVSPKDKGNTYDVLSYVEKNSDAKLMVIGNNDAYNLKDFETIIIGSGIYGGNLHNNLIKWLKQIDKTEINEHAKFYTFFTWFGRGKSDKSTMIKVKNMLKEKQINLEDDYITCFGGNTVIRRSHPNNDDYQKILNWIKSKKFTTAN